jgi:transketolase
MPTKPHENRKSDLRRQYGGDATPYGSTSEYLCKPTYIRICRNNDYILPVQFPNFTIGKAIRMREGDDIALIATGGMLKEALFVANVLQEQGLSICVLNIHTIKPIDKTAILDCAKCCKAVFTLEENTVLGGLGGAVAETLLQNNVVPMYFDMFGIPDTHARVSGTRDYLNEYYRLDVKSMVTRINEKLKS